MKFLVLCLCLPLLAYGQQPPKRTPMTLQELGIEVKGASREVAYTNKEAGVFYTETNASHRSAWQGWRVMSREIMEDYSVEIDGVELRRSDIVRAVVYPHQIVREYANGVRETVTLLDFVNAIWIEIDSVRGDHIAVRPIFSDLHSADDFTLKTLNGGLMIGRNGHLAPTPAERYPGWIAVSILPASEFALSIYEGKEYGRNFSPAALRSGLRSTGFAAVIAAGDSAEAAADLASSIVGNYKTKEPVSGRKKRIEQLLNRSYLRTGNGPLDKALAWARVSLDALIMNQTKKGIFAGLPWFDDYWGRDSFISLPGATLVTGNFADAKSILRSFAEWQDTLPTSPTYGRIPNTVTTNSISYNSADGTPRFVRALGEYIRYSGDTTFAKEMYRVVSRSIEGTLKYHADRNYFLTHGDAETWMDAVGPRGGWSPRGNRADDVQALWYDELRVGAELARMAGAGGPERESADRWSRISDTLAANFNRQFLRAGGGEVYDHLRPGGAPDLRMRPNQLFAIGLVRDETVRRTVFENVTRELVYSHGVATLSQEDEDFHPYHHYPPFYVPDEAYHNGIVWPWLAGRWIDLAASYGLSNTAFEVTGNMSHQLLDRGAVGTLSELLDAAPRPGQTEPSLSGAYSQAWSLAEFVRSFYQAYLGVEADAPGSTLTLKPRLPSAIPHADFDAVIGSSTVAVGYEAEPGSFSITLSSQPKAANLNVVVYPPVEFATVRNDLPAGSTGMSDLLLRGIRTQLPPGGSIQLKIDKNGVTQADGSGTSRLPEKDSISVPDPRRFAGLKLASPLVRPWLKALRPPPYPLLTLADIKPKDPSAVNLYDAADPEGDDTGPGTYTYPKTPSLKPGSLDIVHFSVSADKSNLYFRLQFRELSDPGWHPEYGFQLTYAAIAIDKDGKPGSGQTKVGMNSKYTFSKDFGFEEIIYVGGGIRIEDSKGKVLAEYMPAPGDERDPLGNAGTKTIQFGIPQRILGSPQAKWRYAVLIGAQDDHGGAGIGDFRSVEAVAGEWVGGGKPKPDDPNVYDVLLPKK